MIDIVKISGEEQKADILIKPMAKPRYLACRAMLSLLFIISLISQVASLPFFNNLPYAKGEEVFYERMTHSVATTKSIATFTLAAKNNCKRLFENSMNNETEVRLLVANCESDFNNATFKVTPHCSPYQLEPTYEESYEAVRKLTTQMNLPIMLLGGKL